MKHLLLIQNPASSILTIYVSLVASIVIAIAFFTLATKITQFRTLSQVTHKLEAFCKQCNLPFLYVPNMYVFLKLLECIR